MNEYTFEMVPGLVGRITELLESIDSKLDKVNVAPIPTDDTPELMNVKDLGRYLPSHPAPSTKACYRYISKYIDTGDL